MFACLYALTAPLAARVAVAEQFTPRFEVMGPLVMLDVSGLSKLFGTPKAIGQELRRAASGPVRIALAPTQTAAALLAMGRPGLTVIDEAIPAALAALPVMLLGELDRLRLCWADERGMGVPLGALTAPNVDPTSQLVSVKATAPPPATAGPPRTEPPLQVGVLVDGSPGAGGRDRISGVTATASPHRGGGGWRHPRESHAAGTTRRPRRVAPVSAPLEHPHAGGLRGTRTTRGGDPRRATSLSRMSHAALRDIEAMRETLQRWGIKTFEALAALPPGEVYERLGARGVLWQRMARGEDTSPLVPWVPEEPFEATMDLEWPIEGLEPLSFVLGRLLEPIVNRLERMDRGAVVLHTHLRLVSKTVHARTVPLPAPMRDPRTLRTLVLLDLESNPPSAAIDRVRLLVEPTPARVTQWTLFERAQPSPEQVSTLVARLTALMGEGHVGSPALTDSWNPGAFAMRPFRASEQAEGRPSPDERSATREGLSSALRRFRLPVPARVTMHEGRPVRVLTDRRGFSNGAVVQAAGPWRTSGEWWHAPGPLSPIEGSKTRPSGQAAGLVEGAGLAHRSGWDRDEWDVAMADGVVYRLSVARDVGQWFIEGAVD